MKAALLLTPILIFGLFNQAGSLPRYAYRVGVSCQSCHVNPTGGGMRSVYGVTYGQETLPVKAWREELGIENYGTQITDAISFGADLRTRIIYRAMDTHTSFLQTQGDLYLSARVNKVLGVYVNKGITSGTEVFGIARVLPLKGYVKAGRFTPAYGIRLEDRNNRAEDTGFEVGFAPGIFTLSTGVFNGSGNEDGKAFAARSDVRVELGEVKTSVGGSILNQPSPLNDLRLLSAFGGISAAGVTLFGEVDFRRDKNDSGTRNGLSSYVEGDVLLTDGLDLKFIYEYVDPDRDLKSGSTSTYTMGFEFFPVAGIELRPLYLIRKEEPDDTGNNEFHLLLHFYL